MFIFYDIGLVLSLLIGGAIGLLLAKSRYDHIVMRQCQYEAEVGRYLEVYATLALDRQAASGTSPDWQAPTA
ncbi:MAG TPA: hypothetical protein VFQ44_04455 [Streptosporangiaceae bacterium]|nr:hypothetical protein [Streptosporangiaceae bacterium]